MLHPFKAILNIIALFYYTQIWFWILKLEDMIYILTMIKRTTIEKNPEKNNFFLFKAEKWCQLDEDEIFAINKVHV